MSVASIDVMRCPACDGAAHTPFAQATDTEYRTTDAVYNYHRCAGCRSVFLEDPPTDRLRDIYPPNYYSYAESGSGGVLDRIKRTLDARLFRRLLARIPGDDLAVLDVGGGSGWLLSLARDVSPRVSRTHEVDIDEGARACAEAAGHVFHCTPVEQFASDDRFDLILLLNLIEHVADPGAVLRAMAAVLSPAGLLLLKTPNVDTLDCRLFRQRNWGGFHCPRHFVLFTRDSLRRLAERSGLEVVETTYTQGGPQWAASVLGWLSTRGSIHLSPERPMYRHPLYGPAMAAGAAFDFLRRPFAPTAQMFAVLRARDAT